MLFFSSLASHEVWTEISYAPAPTRDVPSLFPPYSKSFSLRNAVDFVTKQLNIEIRQKQFFSAAKGKNSATKIFFSFTKIMNIGRLDWGYYSSKPKKKILVRQTRGRPKKSRKLIHVFSGVRVRPRRSPHYPTALRKKRAKKRMARVSRKCPIAERHSHSLSKKRS